MLPLLKENKDCAKENDKNDDSHNAIIRVQLDEATSAVDLKRYIRTKKITNESWKDEEVIDK